MSLKTKQFILDELKLGDKTRKDTIIILSYLYDEVKTFGINETILGQYIYIRNYLNSHRELIDNSRYSIIGPSTIIQRLDLINTNKLSADDKDRYIESLKNNNICSIIPNISINKVNIDYIFNPENNKKKKVVDNNWGNKTGIYGIYVNNKIVYIGKTTVSFKERFNEHIRAIKNDDSWKYQQLRKYKTMNMLIQMKPLIIIEDLQMVNKNTINNKELCCIELALIHIFQPELNTEGRLKPYVFRN